MLIVVNLDGKVQEVWGYGGFWASMNSQMILPQPKNVKNLLIQ